MTCNQQPQKLEMEDNSMMNDIGTMIRDGHVIQTLDTPVKWSDVIGLQKAKEALEQAVIIPSKFPHLFTQDQPLWHGILLYGAPGCGKTYLSKALASSVDNSKFYRISLYDVMSGYVTSRIEFLRGLFDEARRHHPTILVLDDFDLIGGDSSSLSPELKRVKTEILVQIQGVGKDTGGLHVLCLSSKPWAIDIAILKRLRLRLHLSVPDADARAALIAKLLSESTHSLNDDDIAEVARQTNGYTPADLCVIVRAAIMQPVRRLQSAKYFRICSKDESDLHSFYEPCGVNDEAAIAMSLMDLEPDNVKIPKTSMDDVLQALDNCAPSNESAYLAKLNDFAQQCMS